MTFTLVYTTVRGLGVEDPLVQKKHHHSPIMYILPAGGRRWRDHEDKADTVHMVIDEPSMKYV